MDGKIKAISISVLALGFGVLYFFNHGTKDERSNVRLEYVVTETKGPDSFDPKDADKTQNLSVMRMLYATPLEITADNTIGSLILKSYKYDEVKKQVQFEIREDVTYSDGTPITLEDLVLAISRTAYFRPEFPVIKRIKGVKEWSQSQMGLGTLPSGINVHGKIMTIDFDRAVPNPLFRFCLELFSVIPRACIDLKTGQMTCELPPSSGYFTLKSKSSEEIVFQKRVQRSQIGEHISYNEIVFRFKSIRDACRNPIQPNQIIAASEIDFLAEQCSEKVQDSQVHWMPSSRFLVLRFNPNAAIFKEIAMRHFFAKTVRSILQQKNSNLIIEKSLFPKLLPGYLNSTDLIDDGEDLSARFNGIKVKLPRIKSFGALIFDSIIEASQKLKMDVEIVPEAPMSQIVDSFLSAEFPVIAGSSGFWAQDPVGDVSMWFTKNLHKPMKFIWDDPRVYSQIEALEAEREPKEIKSKMEGLNKYLYHQALILPVLHFRRCFITAPDVSQLQLPQAVTSPAPWQLTVSK